MTARFKVFITASLLCSILVGIGVFLQNKNELYYYYYGDNIKEYVSKKSVVFQGKEAYYVDKAYSNHKYVIITENIYDIYSFSISSIVTFCILNLLFILYSLIRKHALFTTTNL